MKYRDLVQFDPVVDIKVLVEADDLEKAREDVRTFVFSDRILNQLRDVIVPNLEFDRPQDNKGLLIVGNYGTGKTHLMSAITAIGEHAALTGDLRSQEAEKAFEPIAGRFQVIRAEIGATTMGLRDIVCRELENGLRDLGIGFSFPDLSQVTNTKDSILDMMVAFEAKHENKGLLFALDELLDYLRGRRDAELVLDLAFLREVGEVCRTSRFRFMGGIQEALFDNPRFANVAENVRRVKDRFEQVRISREDVAFVVKERLLRKTTEQKSKIQKHLGQFTPLYEGMAENLDEFVALFPVHPAYIRIFERITPVEKREVLKTLSKEINRLLDEAIPTEEPGLICYDGYRGRMAEDPSVRTIPEVREVLEKSEVLRNRVEKSMSTKQYIPVALRIVDGLAVHRLTTEDIRVPLGATVKELRDDLCLMPPKLPERDAFFLEATIDSVIDGIMKAVSGQFISRNPDNGQIYLDILKDIDYDQKIEARAVPLDKERLDDAYFRALEVVLERRDTPYVAGYRIWEYELPWTDHRVTRFGYLFMGAPNERSTAQPPRDFYIYFLQPYAPPKFKDEEKADEVFFRLDNPDDEFTHALRRYAGATALAVESTATHRSVYEEKARGALQTMVTWLRAQMGEAVSVTYRGRKQPLRVWLGTAAGPRGSVKDQVDTIAARSLTPHFEARYPGYPKFSVEVTRANLPETARQALAHIALGRKTDLSGKVLQSLALIDAQAELRTDGEFAHALTERLRKSGGKAANREQLLEQRDRGVFTWPPWHLEPVWLVVVAAVLTQLGRAEIGFPGIQIDALSLEQLIRMNVDELESFSSVAPPKELPVVQLREVAKLLAVPPGVVSDQGINGIAVQQFLTQAAQMLKRVTEARAAVQSRRSLWGAVLLEQPIERDARLGALQKLLEDIKARSSVGKMNKLNVGLDAVDAARKGLDELNWVEAALEARNHLADIVEYLLVAAEVFGPDFPLAQEVTGYRSEVLGLFRDEGSPPPSRVVTIRVRGEDLRRRFAEAAIRAHNRDRLDGVGDEQKRQILEGDLYRDLQTLASVSLLPQGVFAQLQGQLASVGTCKTFEEAKLMDNVICPDCGYRPKAATGPTARALVEGIDDQLRRLRQEWVKTLADNLAVPELKERINMLSRSEAKELTAFVTSRELPRPVTKAFAQALDQVFKGFDVRRVSKGELWQQLFPESTPTTPDEFRSRFDSLLTKLMEGAAEEKVRILPGSDEEGPR